jgi:hypothetical protein
LSRVSEEQSRLLWRRGLRVCRPGFPSHWIALDSSWVEDKLTVRWTLSLAHLGDLVPATAAHKTRHEQTTAHERKTLHYKRKDQ